MEILRMCITSFLVGGLFSAIAQILIDKTALTPARILVIYVSSGVFIGALGLFEPLLSFAGCGASVPLIGFGGAIARGVREAIDKTGAIGILTGGFTASAAGCAAALIFGYIAALVFRGGPKRS